MAMNAYTGATGAGKTHQVTEYLICKEIAQGRSIVTNIEGLDLDGVYWYILCKNRDLKERVTKSNGQTYQREKIVCLGSLRHISSELIETSGDDFFPSLDYVDGKPHYNDSESVVKNGEYIIIDEAPNWWGDDCKISKKHAQFFREHRHFTNEITGESCDIVFLSQDISYMHRSLRRKGGIRYTFWIEKLDMVGLTKRYKMLMYSGCNITARTKPERIEHGEYREEVWLLYDSYAKGKGKEKIMDSRQNVLNNPKKWKFIGAGILVFLVVAFFMVRSLMNFFSPKTVAAPGASQSKPGAAPRPASPAPSIPTVSDYRVIGWYKSGRFTYVVVRSATGAVRTLVNPSRWVLGATRYSGMLEGKMASEWTGSEPDMKREMK